MLAGYTVISSEASSELARRISRKLRADFVKADLRVFPDGEKKITLSSTKFGRNTVVIVQSTFPQVDSSFVQALSLIHKIKERHKNKIIAVIPYLGYARQDKEFLPGEIITMQVIAKLFRSAGVSKVLVVDIHSKIALKQFKSIGKNISAIPNLAKYLEKKLDLKKNPTMIVSPDVGGADRAKQFAKELFDSEFIVLQKKRDRKTGKVKIISPNITRVKNKDLILIDDMISTGGSIIKATEFLKKQKCKRIFVVCTHALLIDDALKKMQKAGVFKVISTNTIPNKTSVVDISDALSSAIQHINRNNIS